QREEDTARPAPQFQHSGVCRWETCRIESEIIRDRRIDVIIVCRLSANIVLHACVSRCLPHDPDPEAIATGAGLVARVPECSPSLRPAAWRALHRGQHPVLLALEVPRVLHLSVRPRVSALGLVSLHTGSGGPRASAAIGPPAATTLPSAGSAPGRTIPDAESPASPPGYRPWTAPE